MKLTLSIALTTSLAALTNAHGYFVSPKARQPGPAYEKSCGTQAFNMMSGDINGNIQGLEQVVAGQSDYNPKTCHLWSVAKRQTPRSPLT
jgi:predicted carbohydrate-binding protein with CBM5 and CBM33 domain